KGCSTTAWLKAKPEWAKGARLARITPRYNPQVNDFWMCDIGRFQYLWVEGEGGASHVHVAWRRTEKPQPKNTKFRVPAVDAPNVNGAKDLGLAVTAK